MLAIEHERAAALRLRRAARDHDLAIRVRHADATHATVRGPFGFVIVTNLLHHLPRAAGRRVIARLQRATAPSGIHVITVFTTNAPRQDVRTPFAPGELRALYAGWDILAAREWTTRPLRFGGKVAVAYPYAAIVARRAKARRMNLGP